MNCQRCGSARVLECNAKASDCQFYKIGNRMIGPGYAPGLPFTLSGDYLSPDICLDCGQTQGKFPVAMVKELEEP